MLKKLLLAVATLVVTMGFAFAQVDVNKADQAALDGLKGVGPKMSKAILGERKKGGEFKDWNDLEQRVKGIGGKSSLKLSDAGLTVNGQSKATSAESKEDKKPKASPNKDTKSGEAKKEQKADEKKT